MRKPLLFYSFCLLCLAAVAAINNAAAQSSTITIGSGTQTSTYMPIYAYYGNNYSQMIYTAADMAAAGQTGGCEILELGFFLQSLNGSPTSNFNNWTIYLGNTSKSAFTSADDWISPISLTEVYSGTVPLVEGQWNMINLTSSFAYTGGNLVVAVREEVPGYSSTSQIRWRFLSNSYERGMLFYSDGETLDAQNPQEADSYDEGVAQLRLVTAPLQPCSGTPSATLTASTALTCPDVAFALQASPDNFSGLSFQFQSSTSSSGPWTNLGAAQPNGNRAIGGISSATYYRVMVTCAGGGSYTSDPITVSVLPGTQCYCTPVSYCGDNSTIDDFFLFGENETAIEHTGSGCDDINYDFTGMSVDLAQGQTYNGSLTTNKDEREYYKIWIDFNDNGLFDPTEMLASADNYGYEAPQAFSIAVPATAPLGTHRMRVRTAGHVDSIANACTSYPYSETQDYTVNVIAPPACLMPQNLQALPSATAATFMWQPVSGAAGYEYELRTSGTPGSGSAGLEADGTLAGTATDLTVSSLTADVDYRLYIRTNCGSGSYSSWLAVPFYTPFLDNDNAWGAIPLTVGAGCTGAAFTNELAGQSAGEPNPSCAERPGYKTVWFKVVAPPSGTLRISTDVGSGNTLTDTRLALFDASDPNDYSTFSIITCDDDAGTVLEETPGDEWSTYMSTLYAVGLTPGKTYYVQVDGNGWGWGSSPTGTFCIAAEEINSSMISSSTNCEYFNVNSYHDNAVYTGWISITDHDGKLVAMGKVAKGATPQGFDVSQHINAGPVRDGDWDGNTFPYLDRNFHIWYSEVHPSRNSSGGGVQELTSSEGVSWRLFILPAEVQALAAVALGASTTTLELIREENWQCEEDFSDQNNNISLHPSTGVVGTTGFDYIETTTNEGELFNLYFRKQGTPLPVQLLSIAAANEGPRNRVSWQSADESGLRAYELEASVDGRSFAKIATVQAVGRAFGYQTYHNDPVAGKNYYRLKLIAVDGTTAYSKTVHATVGTTPAGFALRAYPNPVSQDATVEVAGAAADGTVLLTNATGQVISRHAVSTGSSVFSVAMQHLPAGIYFLKYADASHTQVLKITKQ